MDALTDFIRRLPKAELHMHVEGSLEPEMMFDLARRNRVALPFASVEAVRAAYSFSRLQDFLDIYYQGAAVLLTEADFHDLALAYFRRAAADGAVRCEIFFDPQTHTDRGLPFRVAIEGLLSGMATAEALDLLHVDRIDHGNRALEDEALTARLVREGRVLTVCPLSNLKLCGVPSLEMHPLKRMLQLGLKATVNSDDPAYFGGYLLDNWVQTARAVGLERDHLVTLARNSLEGAFWSESERQPHLARLDSLAAGQ